jgi:predicted transcriptional regulator
MVLRKLRQEAEIALRHLEVLEVVKENQPIGIFKLAEIMNMPKHKIRYSLRILEQSGIIEPTQYGAIIKDDSDKIFENLKKEIEEISEYVNKLNKIIQEL